MSGRIFICDIPPPPPPSVMVSEKEAKALGLKLFYTGVPCIRGHLASRRVSNRTCILCEKKRFGDWWAENGEAVLPRNREWKKEHPERVKQTGREWGIANTTRRVWYARDRYDAQHEHITLTRRLYTEQNRIRIRARGRKWLAANPGAGANSRRARRARERNAPGRHTIQDVLRIYARQKGRCVYCKIPLRQNYHVDHIMPLSLGGTNLPDNLQCLCVGCNKKKTNKTPEQFARIIGLLI